MNNWNSRFVAYAKAHGHTPSSMLKHDEDEWPGGIMCGFILWMREMNQKFLKANPSFCCVSCNSKDFDKFLKVSA